MSIQEVTSWEEANQRYLLAALELVSHELEQRSTQREAQSGGTSASQHASLLQSMEQAAATLPAPASLDRICRSFGLSPFERDLLLLCAGIELDSKFSHLCAQVSGGSLTRAREGDAPFSPPTFSLALASLPHAHWDALTPERPLRYWQLLTVGQGATLTSSPLHIDEPILHYLAGLPYYDQHLGDLIQAVQTVSEPLPSYRALTEHLVSAWTTGETGPAALFACATKRSTAALPILHLYGNDSTRKSAVAACACQELGLRLYSLSAEMLPVSLNDVANLARLWERQALLTESALVLDCDEYDLTDPLRARAVNYFLQQGRVPLFLTSRERSCRGLRLQRPATLLEIQPLKISEQRQLWQKELGELKFKVNDQIGQLTMQFNLNSVGIRAASAQVLQKSLVPQEENESIGVLLWEACRQQARSALDELALRIDSQATWRDLVLPPIQQELLHEIVAQVRQRATVYETWGFGAKSGRGLGISALFAGTSGTGKTLAAEVLAHELRLDLYRIDLSSVVSKYIGETEKNLRRIFDAAEAGGAILLFDEADALFGKRSEVKDSHDRYANIEVSYLLQRMEAYRGLAVLTTNLKNALDFAFLRRIRFIVQFPFPDAPMRAEIWKRILPPSLPTEDLNIENLARLHVAGGNIRNIALHAAFLAAEAREPVRMTHLLRAASTEYLKLEKPLTEAEIGGWI